MTSWILNKVWLVERLNIQENAFEIFQYTSSQPFLSLSCKILNVKWKLKENNTLKHHLWSKFANLNPTLTPFFWNKKFVGFSLKYVEIYYYAGVLLAQIGDKVGSNCNETRGGVKENHQMPTWVQKNSSQRRNQQGFSSQILSEPVPQIPLFFPQHFSSASFFEIEVRRWIKWKRFFFVFYKEHDEGVIWLVGNFNDKK